MGQGASALTSSSSNPNGYLTATQAATEYQPKGDYALKSSIPTVPPPQDLSNYTQKSDFPKLIQPYVTGQLANYATTASLQQATSGLAKQSDLAALQQTVGEIPASIQQATSGLAKQSDLSSLQQTVSGLPTTSTLTNYAKESEITGLQSQLQNNYVTNSSLLTTINNAIKAAMPTANVPQTNANTPPVIPNTNTGAGQVTPPTIPPVIPNTNTGAGQVTPPIYSSYPFTDYPGQGDISSQPGNGTTCTALCNGITGCTGFATDGNTCFFKNNTVTTPAYNSSLTYYYKGTAPPGPATAPQKQEVFLYSTGGYPYANSFTYSQAQNACPSGSSIATIDQLSAAQQAGADWCNYGWVNNTTNGGTGGGIGAYPANTTGPCSNQGPKVYTNAAGSLTDTNTKYNVTCYGVKPPQGTPNIVPFNSSLWSQFSTPFAPNNQFIKNVANTNYCMDVPNASKGDLYPIQTWTCTVPQVANNQNWKLSNGALVNQNSGLCLDIEGWGKTAGTQVGQYTCSGGANQQWVYNNDKTLTSPSAPGMCLDITGSTPTNGSALQINTCNGNQTQKWTL